MIWTSKSVKAALILENGDVFRGRSFGHISEAIGEVVFTTTNPGYQEIITDPANTGRIVVMTSPMIGNYGINLEDMESDSSKINGLIVREKCDAPNNWRCEMELAGYLKQQRIMALEGIDTRRLTITLREQGLMKGIITPRELSASQIHEKFAAFSNKNAVRSCTTKNITEYLHEGGKNLAVLDLGIKNSILDALLRDKSNVTVFPAFTTADEILKTHPHEIFVSDGPGLPDYIPQVTDTLTRLLDRQTVYNSKPFITARGLGSLCLALAVGCKLGRLPYGHHSGIPIKELETGRIYSPTQNHDIYVEHCPLNVTVTHTNILDSTVEGFKIKGSTFAVGTMF